MIQLLKFHFRPIPINYYTTIKEVMQNIIKENVPIDELYNSYGYDNIFVLAFYDLPPEECFVITKLLAIRMFHMILDDFEIYHCNNFFIYNQTLSSASKDDLVNILTVPIIRSFYPRNKVDFLNIIMNDETIISYCQSNATKPLWSLFFESLSHYRNRVNELPKDNKVWVSSTNDHFMVNQFLNMVVRGQPDYVCYAYKHNNIRIEGTERIGVFKPAIECIDLILTMASGTL